MIDFLRVSHFDKLYIVGDFIDLWQLRRSRHWPQEHSDVLQKLLRKARKGTPIIFIPGNHDLFCLNFIGTYGNISLVENDVHTTADGRRLLVMHAVTMNAEWLSHIGDFGYNLLLKVNWILNLSRRIFGQGHWSLSAYIKAKVKSAVNFISTYEESVARYARQHGARGIVCGHIHTPAIRRFQDIEYYNTGNWAYNLAITFSTGS